MWLLVLFKATLAVQLKIGILALQGSEQVLSQWNQTFETFLPAKIDEIHADAGLDVSATHVNFTVVPLNFHQVFDATATQQIDLIFANPLLFACLERELGVRLMATVEAPRLGTNLDSFGAVIFARSDSQIHSLSDIKGKVFSAVDFTSLEGFQAAWLTLSRAGLSPFVDPAMTVFAETDDQVVKDVLNGTADVGTVRTDSLERWFSSYGLTSGEVRILTPRNYSGFPFLISTELYPEWPLGVVTNVDEETLRDISKAMMDLAPDPLGSYSRWLLPLSYHNAQQLVSGIGFLNQSRPSSCIRPDTLYESIVCPSNYYKLSASEFAIACENCPLAHTCSCKPCQPTPPARFVVTPGTAAVTCSRMQTCVVAEELDVVVFSLEDTWKDILNHFDGEEPVNSVKFSVNDPDEDDWVNATLVGTHYTFSYQPTLSGIYVVEVAVNGKQIDASPFILDVKTKSCVKGQVSDHGLCQLPDHNLIGFSAKVFGWVMAGICLVVLVGLLVWVIVNRKAKPVAASQPFFLAIMLLGCTLTILAVFPASMDDEAYGLPFEDTPDLSYPSLGPACEAQVWLYSLGFCFTFGALFAKVNRIRRVFHTKVFTRIRIDLIDMLPQTLGLVVLMSIIKLAWTLSDPYSYKRFILDVNEGGQIIATRGKCVSDTDSEYLAAIILIQLSCYAYGMYLCYVTRDFRAEFNESRYITFCMGNNFQVLLLGAPAAALVADRIQALYLVKVFVVLLTVAGQVAFLFAPKMFLLLSKGPNPDSYEHGSKQSTSQAATTVTNSGSGNTQNRTSVAINTPTAPKKNSIVQLQTVVVTPPAPKYERLSITSLEFQHVSQENDVMPLAEQIGEKEASPSVIAADTASV